MTKRISGMSFDITLAGMSILVSKANLDITDNTAVAQTRGIPDGFVDGDVAAEGELELDTQNFDLLSEVAAKAGSWRGIEVFDMLFLAEPSKKGNIKVEVFGCKLLVSNLLDIDSKGGDKTMHKVKFIVTSPDFIHINGCPYLSSQDTRNLLG